MDLLTNLDYWQWWVGAVIFIVLEILIPGAFLLWLGISAAVVGALLLLFPGMGWEAQFLVFAVLSVASIVAWRAYQKKHPSESDQPALNRRGQQYVGRVFTLEEPIVNGLGKIKVDDTTWKIEGNDSGAGSKVEVVGVDGVVLKVQNLP